MFTEEQILQMMKSLGCDRNEAIQVLKDDLELDGKSIKELESDLTTDQKKAIKDLKKGAKSVDAYGKTRVRTIKEDTDKRTLIDTIAKALSEICTDVQITNVQKYIELEYNGKPYLIDLKFSRNKAKGK